MMMMQSSPQVKSEGANRHQLHFIAAREHLHYRGFCHFLRTETFSRHWPLLPLWQAMETEPLARRNMKRCPVCQRRQNERAQSKWAEKQCKRFKRSGIPLRQAMVYDATCAGVRAKPHLITRQKREQNPGEAYDITSPIKD